ncbi:MULTISPECIES: hypothetical protein [unclassified Pseudomonas]|uniref:hypothetical protein n=1 Tax=unclassified Pseudomonas TaxID=196821 RepID=UPI00249B6421|nr:MULTISPECIES: hypothetical protein [unclassified Pseudomonas]MDI3252811.1 hypothetical protein [Pseudomonas sp. AL10]MDI3268682.1 hypothetical protein [Pseudomonas sp. AL15]
MSISTLTHISGARIGGVLALGPMDIPGVDPLDPNGLVPVSLTLAPLLVRIPMWLPAPEPLDTPHRVQLLWLRDGIERQADLKLIDAPPPPLPAFVQMHVPLAMLRERSGSVELYYRVTDSEGQTSELDPKVTLTIDLESPELLRPDDQLSFVSPPTTGVDEAYLAGNDPVRFNVPPYRGRERNDRIEMVLSNSPNPAAAAPDGDYVLVNTSDPLICELPAAGFRRLNNGQAYIFYQVFDEAGNFSTRSAGLPFVLDLIAGPGVPLPAPTVMPPAYDDTLIKRDDARAGVVVLVPPYANWAAGDQCRVYWNERPVPDVPVSDGVETQVPIPWSILRGPLPVLVAEEIRIRYEIIRGLVSYPSFGRRIRQDFTVAAQDHAGAPALLNPTLPLAEVRGLVSDEANLVDLRDKDVGARARVFLYDDPQPGQVLRFFWNGIGPVATKTVQVGEVAGQLVFSSVIPWGVMEGIIDSSLPVHYITDNGVNQQQSRNTEVDVNTGPLLSFPTPVIQHTLIGGTGTFLTCCSSPEIFAGVSWKVVSHGDFQVNDEVRFFTHGYNNNGWVDPIVQDSRFTQSKTFDTPADLVNGLDFTVMPFDPVVYSLRLQSTAVAWYEVWRGRSKIGESILRRFRVDLAYPAGGFCQAGDVVHCTSDGVPSLIRNDCVDSN